VIWSHSYIFIFWIQPLKLVDIELALLM